VKAGEKPRGQLPVFAEDLLEAFAVLAAELKAEMEKSMAESEAKVQDWMKERRRQVRDDLERMRTQRMRTQRFVAKTPSPVSQRPTYEGFGTLPVLPWSAFEGFGTPTNEGFGTPPLRQSSTVTPLLVHSTSPLEALPSYSPKKTISSTVSAPITSACGQSPRTRKVTALQPQSPLRAMTAQAKSCAALYGTASVSSPASAAMVEQGLTSMISGA